jgi:hypothetical protein
MSSLCCRVVSKKRKKMQLVGKVEKVEQCMNKELVGKGEMIEQQMKMKFYWDFGFLS